MGIYRDKATGNYGVRVEYNGKDYKKIIGPRKREAELALDEIKNEIRLKKLAKQEWDGFSKLQRAKRQRTFADAAKDYMDERIDSKHSTITSYRTILDSHLLPAFGKMALDDIAETHLRKFKARLMKSGKSSTTANNIMQPMRSILGQAYREGHIKRDPSLAVRREDRDRADIDPLSEQELDLALKNVEEHYRAFFTVLAFTGARPNEMQALRWKDIDWNSSEIKVTKGRVRGHEGKPKTKSGIRKIPMTAPVVAALTALKEKRQDERVIAFSADDYVFTTPKGDPINKHMDRVWARGLKRAGLRHRPSYQLRHTFITQCIIKGFPLTFIARVVGHSTIDTIVRHYAGWIEAETDAQEAKLRQAFTILAPINAVVVQTADEPVATRSDKRPVPQVRMNSPW